MAYTEANLNYYKKNPSHITADLDQDLLLELIDFDVKNIEYVKPQNSELIYSAYEKDPSVIKYIDFSQISIQFLEQVIDNTPMMIQHVYLPSNDLMKRALVADLNTLQLLQQYLDEDMYKWLLAQNGLVLEFIPSGKQTEEMVMIAIQENLEAYKYANVKTKATDIYVIEQDPSKISWISNFWPELVLPLVQYNPRFITKFYDQVGVVTKEIIKIALDGEPMLYRTVPEPDFEIMKYTIDLDLDMFEYMPYNHDLITYAIETNGLALKYVKKKDLKTIKQAVSQNVLALDYVEYPRQFLIDFAFKKDGLALKYVTNPPYEQCLDAVRRNPFAIEFVPAEHRTKDLQMYALMGGVKIIPLIGEPADDEVVLQVLRIEPSYIFKITDPTSEMFMTAFKAEGRLMLFYHNWNTKFNFDEMAAALSHDGTIFEDIKNKTRRLALVAIEQYPPAIQWTMGALQNLEIAKLAVSLDPRTIFFVEKDILDSELLNLAISMDPDYFERTSGELTWEQWLEIIGQN